jgi:hypothetical protein
LLNFKGVADFFQAGGLDILSDRPFAAQPRRERQLHQPGGGD